MDSSNIGSGIRAECVQSVLDSASNGADKGQAQWFTPIELGHVLGMFLPKTRPVIADFSCGAGHLLLGVASDTDTLLGVDVDPIRTVRNSGGVNVEKITGDICKVYGLLAHVGTQFDLIVQNPPYDLHWYRENLKALANSTLGTVRSAFNGVDERLSRECIDSTVASMLMALDRMSDRGEGLIIANGSTVDRLITGPNAPHRALKTHIWLRLDLQGNPCTGDSNGKWTGDFITSILFFARGHANSYAKAHSYDNLGSLLQFAKGFQRWGRRAGYEVTGHVTTNKDTTIKWRAVKSEWKAQNGGTPEWNIWMENGVLKTNLTVFNQLDKKIDKREAERLHSLHNQSPMNLVIQATHRQDLLRAVNGGIWRVHPDVPGVVKKAIADYNSVRAPLTPFTNIKGLGYLDEESGIICTNDLLVSAEDGKVLASFKAGKSYPVSTQTVSVNRLTMKPSLTLHDEEFLMTGQELGIYLRDEAGRECLAMDSRHKAKGVTITSSDHKRELSSTLTLQQIAQFFQIPLVPSIAECFEDRYVDIYGKLEELGKIIKKIWGHDFRKFQRHDLTAAAMVDGCIFGWDTGLGKTIACFILPLLKVGFVPGFIQPKAPVLIVAPEGLHAQMLADATRMFRAKVTLLDSQETFYSLTKDGRTLPPGYYLTSFTQLAQNKVEKLPDPFKVDCRKVNEVTDMMAFYGVTVDDAKARFVAMMKALDPKDTSKPTLNDAAILVCIDKFKEYKECCGEYKTPWFQRGSKREVHCVYSPALADLVVNTFDVVLADEGVKVKGEDTIIGTGFRHLRPKYRYVLTGTPIKNRLPDVFMIACWVCDAMDGANARWPWGPDQIEVFAQQFLVTERNLDKERALNNGDLKKGRNGNPPKGRPTAAVCNIHRLWKVMGPILVRRRKNEIGEEIVKKKRYPIRVPVGKHQAEVYLYHMNANYVDSKENPAVVSMLNALRMAAAAPHNSHSLKIQSGCADIEGKPIEINRKWKPFSKFDYIPKVHVALSLMERAVRRHEQFILFSALLEPLDVISKYLCQAEVPHMVLDGRIDAGYRGELAQQFRLGRPHAVPILLAGQNSMAEGYSFSRANNAAMYSYDWALDKLIQAINRAHRLDSTKDLNLYPLICDGTIDRKLEAMLDEKGNAADLVLDGYLLGDDTDEVNLAELLRTARAEFNKYQTIDEEELILQWPDLRDRLNQSYLISEREMMRGDNPPQSALDNDLRLTQISQSNDTFENILKEPVTAIFKDLNLGPLFAR